MNPTEVELNWIKGFSNKSQITQKQLYDLYWNEGLSVSGISKHLKISKRAAMLLLYIHNIPRRTKSEGRKKQSLNQALKQGLGIKYTEHEKELLALSIEFEGSIGLSRSKRGRIQVQIQLVNTELPLVQYIHTIAKMGRITPSKKPSKGSHKKAWTWIISNIFVAESFLEQIIPYLISKKERGNLVLNFCRSRMKYFSQPYTEEEDKIFSKTKELNKRGFKLGTP